MSVTEIQVTGWGVGVECDAELSDGVGAEVNGLYGFGLEIG